MGLSYCFNRSRSEKSLKCAWYTRCVLSRKRGSVEWLRQ